MKRRRLNYLGPRRNVQALVPELIADAVAERARKAGMSISERVGNVLTVAAGEKK